MYGNVQADRMCSRLGETQRERHNSTLGLSTNPGQFPAFRVDPETTTGPSVFPDNDVFDTDDDEFTAIPAVFGQTTDGCAEVPLQAVEPYLSQGEGGVIHGTPLWRGRLRGRLQSRALQYVTMYFLNCGEWQLQPYTREGQGEEAATTRRRLGLELESSTSMSSGSSVGRSGAIGASSRVLQVPTIPGDGGSSSNQGDSEGGEADDDGSSLGPRRRNLLVKAKYSMAADSGNHLGTGQEPLVQAYIVLLILNFVVLLLSAAASTRAPNTVSASVMTITLALRAGALACLMQAALLLWALREQSEGVPWRIVRSSIAPAAAAGSALATGTCAGIVYLLSTGWQVLRATNAWSDHRAVWVVLLFATISQAIRQAVAVPVHPAVPEAFLTAIPQAGQAQASQGLTAATGVLGVVTSLAFLYILWWAVSRANAFEATEVADLRARGYPFRANAVARRAGLFLGIKRSFVMFLIIYGATQVLRVSSVFSQERQWLEVGLPVAGFQLCFLYILLLYRPSGGVSAVDEARRDPRYQQEIDNQRNLAGPPIGINGAPLGALGANGRAELVLTSRKWPREQAAMALLKMPSRSSCL